jgi:beta-lactam-binding protein with PASTA domain
VPKVVGKTLARAKRLIRTAGCRPGRVRKARSSKKAGLVIGQRPKPGKVVARSTAVTLVVSSGRRPK